MTDVLHSPRSRADALRVMLTVAIRDATEEELLALHERVGPWSMEKVLDAAIAERPKPLQEATEKPAEIEGLPPGKTKRSWCRDADRVRAAATGLRERFARDGVALNGYSLMERLGINASPPPADSKQLAWGTLLKIEEYLRND
jgi:hypothetical protein